MAEATSRQHFIECGFAQHQAETLAVEFNRVNQQPSDLSTLKWAVGLAAVATIAGFGWLGSEIRDIRYGLETHIGGLTSRIGGLENNIVGLDARIGGLGTRIDGLGTRIDGLETRIGGLETNIGGLDARIDGLSIEMAGVKAILEERLPKQQ